jgi:molybdopterin molybdotransferase
VASTAAAPELLTFATAGARVMRGLEPLPTERVPLDQALGRALRADIRSSHGLPPFANSAMDGIVVRAVDLAGASAGSPVTLAIVDTIAAGRPVSRSLEPGQAMRIMTGAPLPAGGDTIVPIEDLDSQDADTLRVRVTRPAPVGEHVRLAGADLAAGALALGAGRSLSPHDLALLAAIGSAEVEVGRRPRVAILSTGDELRDVSAPFEPGTIRDSNTPLLRALVTEAGGVVVHAERLADDPERVAAAITRAFGMADFVISIGGVSAGAFDPVKLALDRLDGIALWRVAMKPGRPQAFGSHQGVRFHGLPGNPASVACVFDTLVRPALRALAGHSEIDRPQVEASAGENIASREGRTDFIRVRLEADRGDWVAHPVGEQISGHLMPQAHAHGLLEIPAERASLVAGETAIVRLWRWPDANA